MQALLDSVSSLTPRERKALAVLLKRQGVNLYEVAPIFARDPQQPLVLSYAQQRQWFLWELDPESNAYHIPVALKLKGALDVDALRAGFASLIARHETLRTTFEMHGDQPLQVIHASQPPLLRAEPLVLPEGEAGQALLKALIDAETRQPFDLQQGPLLRVKLWCVAEEEHVLVLTLHHIVTDGWSIPIMVDELVQLYEGHRLGQPVVLAPMAIQYADYAQWQRQWMEAGEQERQLAYWKSQLGEEQPVLALPNDRPAGVEQDHRGGRVEMNLDIELARSLRQLAQQQGATLFMVLLASFQTLLHRYCGQQDIRVGVPIANRTRLETQGLIGFFVNTQVLKAQFELHTTFSGLLQDIKRTVVDAQSHQDLPFEQLVEALQPERSLSHNPLFQVMYNHQTEATGQSRRLPELSVESLGWNSASVHFDLSLDTHERNEQVGATLSYASALFNRQTIERMAAHWRQLLASIVAQPHRRIAELTLLSDEQRRQMVCHWNLEPGPSAEPPCVHLQIETRAASTPHATALVFDEQFLTYEQLNRRANQLAHKLRELGVGPDVLVGIAMDRSLDLVIGLLAILKAGGAYVPLDPQYPQERLAYMAEDSGLVWVLTQTSLLTELRLLDGLHTLCLDQEADWLDAYSAANPVNLTVADNLAYVIYTSGSTGKPKGVAMAHRELAMFCGVAARYSQLSASDRVLQFATVSFDGFVEQLYPALCCGAQVIMRGNGLWDIATLKSAIGRYGVTVADLPTAYWRMLATDTGGASACPTLRQVHVGGEAMPSDVLDDWARSGLQGARLLNTYGPTEATVVTTVYDCAAIGSKPAHNSGQRTPSIVPIGRPLQGRTVYLCDADLAIAPAGAVNELLIGGPACLARGYLNRPGLTAERFIPDPYGAPGGRLYRSGDLARFADDGVIEYVGRIDHQVKIRGFRIELEEIQARLQEHPAVGAAVVIDVEGANGKQLAAYLVVEAAAADDFADTIALRGALREYLGTVLPDYMVPAHLLFIDALPLTPNGKLDRKALPVPDASLARQHPVAPGTVLEQRITAIWAAVLKVEHIGTTDNFFELGGDSIASIQVVSRARQAGIVFTPKELFQQQTVQGLARVARLSESSAIEQGAVTGELPLTAIAREFFATDIPARHHWNQSVLLHVGQGLQPQQVERALHALLMHHDALRLSFVNQAGHWFAHHADPASSPMDPALLWTRQAASSEELTALCQAAQESLVLERGQLLRALWVDMFDGSQRLLLVIHHLVVDGISWRILLEDLERACRAQMQGRRIALPSKSSSFQAWSQRVQEYAMGAYLQQQLGWWQRQLAEASDALPCMNPHGGRQGRQAATVSTRLSAADTERLLHAAPSAYRTQINDLLLTALARVICRWSGADSTLIRLEGHGREDLFDDLDITRTLGWFTSTFPVRLTPQADLAGSIKSVKEQLRAVPDKGIGYGILRYLGSTEAQASLAALPQGEIVFNYLGQFDHSFEAADGLLHPSAEDSGRGRSDDAPLDALISINGQVYGGELVLSWTFSREVFAEDTLQALADAFASELKALIDHCLDERAAGVTPSDFPLAGLNQQQLDSLPVAASDIVDVYPLSPMQQGMLFHSLEDASGLYINQTSVPIRGLDVERFVAVWEQVVRDHDILRTSFHSGGVLSEPIQLVHRRVELDIARLDWRGRSDTARQLAALIEADSCKGFDLTRAPLMRLTLVQLDDDHQHLIWTSHHVLLDGWSNSQLLGEVLARYAGQEIAPTAHRYRDYIAWLQRQDNALSEHFWRSKLVGLQDVTLLADCLVKPAPDLPGHAALYLQWDAARTAALRRSAQQVRVTPNTLIQAAWLLLLQRYTGQDVVCFGATVAGRPADLAGADSMLGLFINTVAIIQAPLPQQAIGPWLRALQNYNLEARDHEHTSLADVQRWSGRSGQALFDSIIVFENYPVDERLQQDAQGGVTFGKTASRDVTNYAMDLAVHLDDTLRIEFLYLRNRFTEQATAQIMASFEVLLQGLLDHPGACIGALDLVPEPPLAMVEREAVQPLLIDLIAAQACLRPHAVAVQCAGQQLDYGQLEQRANRLAWRLLAQGVKPEARIGVALPRSVDTLVAFYAVLKTGAAYVPLDIDYPRERLAWIIDDAQVSVLLTHSDVRTQLPAVAVEYLNLDELEYLTGVGDSDCPVVGISPDNLAYLIYTSGSSGQPKGVAVSHGPLAMHCRAIVERYEMDSDTRELHFMSFAFDGAQERWLSTLIRGGQLVMRDHHLWTPEQTFQALLDHDISIACFPPAYLQQLAEYAQTQPLIPPVGIYCFGGDAVARSTFELVKRVLRPRYLTNGYGPTETVVTPLLWKADVEQGCGAAIAPIGTAVGERTLYVLDAQFNRLPDGVPGELFIGGTGMARGYHGRPGLSAERFVADPFSRGGRLYRTGDLVRRRPDGIYDYLGRLDNQVKIRGFRIELGEIEACLRREAEVRDAVVAVWGEEGDKRLIGYVVCHGDAADQPAKLRDRLKAVLPEHMVPTRIMVVERFALSPNGKLDRRALPEPDLQGSHLAYVAPRNPLEQQLARIWAEVLGLEQVGVTDNFFELGGDSLRSLKVVSKVRGLRLEGFELKLRDLMTRPTIAELSGYGAVNETLDPLLLLNRKVTDVAPLFCIHAGFGTVFDYEPLARQLEGQRSVYGLQCRMLLDPHWDDESLSAMAIDYAQYLRQKQPNGPYHLLGWSLGGALAALVAQELERQGETVASLQLVDSFIPEPVQGEALSASGWQEDLRSFLRVVLPDSPAQLPWHLLDLSGELDGPQLVAFIQAIKAQSQALPFGSLQQLEADELARGFLVAMRLKAIAHQPLTLQPVRVPVKLYWAVGGDQVIQTRFAQRLSEQSERAEFASGHFDMLANQALLQAASQALHQASLLPN